MVYVVERCDPYGEEAWKGALVGGAIGALVGASDHGANKSLYAKDPDGIEFEVMWEVPPGLLDGTAPTTKALDRGRWNPTPSTDNASYK